MIPRLFTSPETTVAHVIAEYLHNQTARQQRKLLSTAALVKQHFYALAFSEMFGHQPVSACRRGDLKRFLLAHPEYKSAHTMSDACAIVVAAFRWAVEDGLLQTCPYAKPKDLPTPQPRAPIKPEEVRAILGHARKAGYRCSRLRFRLATWFLWETGCRTCEMFALDWSQYDDVRGCFELESKTTRKTGRNRLLVLSARAWRLIRWMRRRNMGIPGPVFLNGRGRRWNKDTFGKLFRRHADKAGVRRAITAYCIRHGFCCAKLEAGAGERQLADVMGHSSTRYIAWYGRGVRQNVEYLRQTADL